MGIESKHWGGTNNKNVNLPPKDAGNDMMQALKNQDIVKHQVTIPTCQFVV